MPFGLLYAAGIVAIVALDVAAYHLGGAEATISRSASRVGRANPVLALAIMILVGHLTAPEIREWESAIREWVGGNLWALAIPAFLIGRWFWP